MPVPQGIQTYQQTSIKTADRRQIVELLYEGVIRYINNAIHAIETHDTATRTAKINRSLEIIQFLRVALDFERGGEIALNLSRLYDYCRDTITMGNIKSDISQLREVIGLFNILLDGWHQMGLSLPPSAEISGKEPSQALSEGAPILEATSSASDGPSPAPQSPSSISSPAAEAPSSPSLVPAPPSNPPAPPHFKGYGSSGKGGRSRAIVG
ncbi:MAG: flagellar export chaperone FliS [Candidatus Sumerlaeota bacterium]|nr:flagellar export chaperone FliS [Candidatus Sumerlaeota bacterium]